MEVSFLDSKHYQWELLIIARRHIPVLPGILHEGALSREGVVPATLEARNAVSAHAIRLASLLDT